VVEINEQGFVTQLVEKPKIPKSNLAIIGLYKIKEVTQLLQSLDYILQNGIKTKDEFQLTDALAHMVSQSHCRLGTEIVDIWFDCGKKDILLETNAMLLKRANYAAYQHAQCENTIIIPPVRIGQNCKIKNSIIGPNVSIGDHAILNHAILHHSIIGNYASLEDIVLRRSIIGNDTSLKGNAQSLNIGDNTEIDFS
jgi:glucose-1-phosphate thymidylyltransferase